MVCNFFASLICKQSLLLFRGLLVPLYLIRKRLADGKESSVRKEGDGKIIG